MRPFYTPHQLRHDQDDILFINEHWDEIKEAYFQVLEALKAPTVEVSWDKVTNKPTLATVATSGSYTDLSNTPTIPTKVSQLENDMGFGTGGGSGDTSDCVHKTGNETIDGVKTFTSGPWVTNNQTTMGFSINNTALARNEVPSELYNATFRALDKNNKILGEYCVEKSTTGSTLLNMNVHSEDSEGNDIMESLYLNLSNDGSTVSFHPAKDNRTDLGMSVLKWANVYATTFNGNLKGNADTATSANSVAWENVTGKPNIPTTPNAYVTETGASGSNWYRKWSNGFIEMGGFTNCTGKPGNVVETNLPIAFSSENYTLMVQLTLGAASDYIFQTATSAKSTTRFEVWVNDGSSLGSNRGGYDWYACGY